MILLWPYGLKAWGKSYYRASEITKGLNVAPSETRPLRSEVWANHSISRLLRRSTHGFPDGAGGAHNSMCNITELTRDVRPTDLDHFSTALNDPPLISALSPTRAALPARLGSRLRPALHCVGAGEWDRVGFCKVRQIPIGSYIYTHW